MFLSRSRGCLFSTFQVYNETAEQKINRVYNQEIGGHPVDKAAMCLISVDIYCRPVDPRGILLFSKHSLPSIHQKNKAVY